MDNREALNMEATDEMIAMARRVAENVTAERDRPIPDWVRAFLRTSALAAIIETTELAAKHLGAVRIGYERNGINADCLGIAANHLRNADHLKGPNNAQ